MDPLTIPRLQAQLLSQTLLRQLASQRDLGGEEGRIAAERLGQPSLQRPDGPLVWMHGPAGVDAAAAAALVTRLDEDLPGVTLLVTAPMPARPPVLPDAGRLLWQHPPADVPSIAECFLRHWRPDAGIWMRQVHDTLLLDAAARIGLPLFLQDAVAPDLSSKRSRAIQTRLLGHFDQILALNASEFEKIRAIGAIPSRVVTSGPLEQLAEPPYCLESERAGLARALGTRPVWLAMATPPAEMPAILDAHRTAKRTLHRLLLILVPREQDDRAALEDSLAAGRWNIARHDAGEEPGETTDIFLGDTPEEAGLYYRLAPVTYLGGTLSGETVPWAIGPATLGSAIIAGPHGGTQRQALRRLQEASACRRLAAPGELAAAVVDLLSPDQAASLALNAWNVATEGSVVLDRLAQLVATSLRDRGY